MAKELTQLEKRLKLHEVFLTKCKNVYFQPSKNTKMKYPAIVYLHSGEQGIYANNTPYVSYPEYQVTVIDRDPDSEIPASILTLPMSSMTNQFISDNLYHTVLQIFNTY